MPRMVEAGTLKRRSQKEPTPEGQTTKGKREREKGKGEGEIGQGDDQPHDR